MVLSRDKVEVVGALRLPLGGVNGYVGVRSRQGYTKDKFQGTTPTKKRRTKLFNSAREAAVALASEPLRRRPWHPSRSRPDEPAPRGARIHKSGCQTAHRMCSTGSRDGQVHANAIHTAAAPHDDQHASVRSTCQGCSESGRTMADATPPSNCRWAAALISCAPHVRRWVVIRRFGAGYERPGRRLRNLGDLAGQEAALEMQDVGVQPL